MEPTTVADFERLADERVPPDVWCYFAGGAEDEVTRAVLVGRPLLFGLAADGEAGVRRVLELLRDELARSLAFLGCTRPDDVSRDHIQPTAPPIA